MNHPTVLLLCSVYALLNVSAASIIKSKLITHKVTGLHSFIIFLLDPKICAAIFLLIVSMFVLMKSLSLARFSYVVPVNTAINFSLTALVGIFLFKDSLNLVSMLAYAFILLGVVLLSSSMAA